MASEGDGARPESAAVAVSLPARAKASRASIVRSRAWDVAKQLHARRGWLLQDAHFERSWTIRVGSTALDLSAYISFFFEGPGFVVALTPSFRKGTRRKTIEVVWSSLRASFGERFRMDPLGTSLWMKIRTDDPKLVLAEIEHIERVLGTVPGKRTKGTPRSRDGRRWYIVETLRANGWQVANLTFDRKVGDIDQRVWPTIAVSVDSDTGRAGLAANFAAWVPQASETWAALTLDLARQLTADGFTVNANDARFFQAGRWSRGLSAERALKQAQAFERLAGRSARVLGLSG